MSCSTQFIKVCLIIRVFRRAARQLPDVCYVANPFETEERMVSGTSEPNVSAELPSEEWRELFEYRFLNFRKVCISGSTLRLI